MIEAEAVKGRKNAPPYFPYFVRDKRNCVVGL